MIYLNLNCELARLPIEEGILPLVVAIQIILLPLFATLIPLHVLTGDLVNQFVMIIPVWSISTVV